LFREEPFKCLRETLVDYRLKWGIYEFTPLQQIVPNYTLISFEDIVSKKFGRFSITKNGAATGVGTQESINLRIIFPTTNEVFWYPAN